MKQPPVIFACSHHRKGNSDLAANLFLEGIQRAGGSAETILLGDLDLHHCIGCLKCRTSKNNFCIFANSDEAQDLYLKIIQAPFTFFASPIYFYHLPSRLKTFIDRGQWAFEANSLSTPLFKNLVERPSYACFVAGRPRGEKLFEGAELSLKYFLKYFKISLEQAISFKNIDSPRDLESQPEKCEILIQAGMNAWKRSTQV